MLHSMQDEKKIIDTDVKMSTLANKTLLNAIKRWLLLVSVKLAHGWPGKKPAKNKCENIIIDMTFYSKIINTIL